MAMRAQLHELHGGRIPAAAVAVVEFVTPYPCSGAWHSCAGGGLGHEGGVGERLVKARGAGDSKAGEVGASGGATADGMPAELRRPLSRERATSTQRDDV
jgi:hypothetical protein